MMSRTNVSLAGVVLAICLGGCGGGGEELPELGLVTGTVTLNGEPLPDVLVTFQPESGAQSSQGTTDEEGAYEIIYGDFAAGIEGAVLGSHTVTIVQGDPANVPDDEKLPARYNMNSELKADVQAGENSIDFDLKTP